MLYRLALRLAETIRAAQSQPQPDRIRAGLQCLDNFVTLHWHPEFVIPTGPIREFLQEALADESGNKRLEIVSQAYERASLLGHTFTAVRERFRGQEARVVPDFLLDRALPDGLSPDDAIRLESYGGAPSEVEWTVTKAGREWRLPEELIDFPR